MFVEKMKQLKMIKLVIMKCMGPVIEVVQRDGESVLYPLFKVTRNYCHALQNVSALHRLIVYMTHSILHNFYMVLTFMT